jgi:hypothetical protein
MSDGVIKMLYFTPPLTTIIFQCKMTLLLGYLEFALRIHRSCPELKFGNLGVLANCVAAWHFYLGDIRLSIDRLYTYNSMHSVF